jgi:hypothetical protein
VVPLQVAHLLRAARGHRQFLHMRMDRRLLDKGRSAPLKMRREGCQPDGRGERIIWEGRTTWTTTPEPQAGTVHLLEGLARVSAMNGMLTLRLSVRDIRTELCQRTGLVQTLPICSSNKLGMLQMRLR